MAKAYRTRSTKSAGGTRRYTTQSSSGGVSTTMSYKTGTGQRTAVTRKANGSVVQTKTHKRADGYTTRERKTIIPKPKTIKNPKPPKMPKMKLSIVKEAKAIKFKPYKAPKTPKPKPFKWPTSKRSSSSTRVKRTVRNGNNSLSATLKSAFLTPILVGVTFLFVFAIFFG